LLVSGGDWLRWGRTHTDMARLRAVENGYSLVRADFNGHSAAFDARGEALSRQDTTVPTGDALWYADIPTRGHAAVYRHTGNILAWTAVVGALSCFTLALARPTGRREKMSAGGDESPAVPTMIVFPRCPAAKIGAGALFTAASARPAWSVDDSPAE
jgi:apolipoprotein N-acyltransferase